MSTVAVMRAMTVQYLDGGHDAICSVGKLQSRAAFFEIQNAGTPVDPTRIIGNNKNSRTQSTTVQEQPAELQIPNSKAIIYEHSRDQHGSRIATERVL